MSQNDRSQLIRFLQNLRQLFITLIEQRNQLYPRFEAELATAWPEIDDLINHIIQILEDPGRFPGPGELDNRLNFAGLAGSQLALKLAAFDAAQADLDNFLEELGARSLSQINISGLAREQIRKLRKLIKLIRRLFAYANVILGSLSQTIPISEPVKEFKDILMEGVDDILDKYPPDEDTPD